MSTGLLIAEPSAGLRKDLRHLFQREFPGMLIDEAGTTAEAESFLGTTRKRDRYAVVILDVKLPPPGGEPFEDALSRLDPLIREPSGDPPAFFLVSTNLLDPKIKERQAEIARRQEAYSQRRPCSAEFAPRQFFFEKGPPGWDLRLRNEVRSLIHTRRIRERIDELLSLFGPSSAVESAGVSPRAGYRRGPVLARGGRPAFDPTQRLASLVRDIETNWEYLGEDIQNTIKEYFVVRPTERGGVQVGLL
jgi:hypothetical protein